MSSLAKRGVPAVPSFRAYWESSRRPLASLAFLAPMLLAYEVGLRWSGPEGLRNGADVWLRGALERFGFTQFLVLPLLTCGILVAWHHLRRERWHVGGFVVYGMWLESLLLGTVLLCVAHAQTQWSSVPMSLGAARHVVAFFGAGIYEEMLFRLLLVPVLAVISHGMGAPRRARWWGAVIVTSLLFAAAHYQFSLDLGSFHCVLPVGELFAWSSFLFRLTAGAFFAVVFVYRGFGVAAGTHAFYDILVTLE